MTMLIDFNNDGSRAVTVDNGDGTGTRTTYDPEGVETGSEPVTLPLPDAEDEARAAFVALVQAIGGEAVGRSAVLGSRLATHASDLWDGLAAMPLDDPARPTAEAVTDAAITAATAEIPN